MIQYELAKRLHADLAGIGVSNDAVLVYHIVPLNSTTEEFIKTDVKEASVGGYCLIAASHVWDTENVVPRVRTF